MRHTRVVSTITAAWALALCATGSAGAITTSEAWVAGSIPITPTADVAYAGTSLFVGQGSFGGGTQSIARHDSDGSLTTVVTGLNSIGALAYDPVGDRLLFTDNALEAPGASTGDTVYALPAPTVAAGSVAAAGLALVPAGSIPAAQAVLPLADGSVLVGDAAGGSVGRVVVVSGGATSDLVTGLGFTAGLALDASGDLLVGNVDSVTFAGEILRFDLAGTPLGTLIAGLNGAFDQALADGDLLLTGGFTVDFSSSTLVRITPGGSATEEASGLSFSSGLDVDPPSGQVALVDFGATEIHTLTPIAHMTPGGRGRRECYVEAYGQTPDTSPSGRIRKRWTCTDGDSCDRDGQVNGSCSFAIGVCLNVPDSRLADCEPTSIDGAIAERLPRVDGSTAFAELQSKVDAVVAAGGSGCSDRAAVTVDAGRRKRVRIRGLFGPKTLDRDAVTMRCLR